MSTENLLRETDALLAELGVEPAALSGDLPVHSPMDGRQSARFGGMTAAISTG